MSERSLAGSPANRYIEGDTFVAVVYESILMHFRFSFLLLISLFAIAGSLSASPQAEAEIRQVLDAQVEAWNRGDIDGYMKGYARGEATEFVSGDSITRGWQTVRDRYAKKYDDREKMGTLSFADLAISVLSGEAAFVTGAWKLVRHGDQPHGRFTLLIRRLPEGWRIVHDHSS